MSINSLCTFSEFYDYLDRKIIVVSKDSKEELIPFLSEGINRLKFPIKIKCGACFYYNITHKCKIKEFYIKTDDHNKMEKYLGEEDKEVYIGDFNKEALSREFPDWKSSNNKEICLKNTNVEFKQVEAYSPFQRIVNNFLFLKVLKEKYKELLHQKLEQHVESNELSIQFLKNIRSLIINLDNLKVEICEYKEYFKKIEEEELYLNNIPFIAELKKF